jgi:hypothetical protein
MEWEIVEHNEEGYLEVVTKGIADKDGSMNMAQSIASIMREHRLTKVLIDHRNITDVSGSVLDTYARPTLFRRIGVLLGIRIAAVINPAHSEHFKFLETVCYNQGFSYSVFSDKESALIWFSGK